MIDLTTLDAGEFLPTWSPDGRHVAFVTWTPGGGQVRALLTFAGIEKIFLVKDGKAVEKNISTGRRASGFIEIAVALKAERRVVERR